MDAFVLKGQSWLVATKPIQHKSQNTNSLALYKTSLPTPDLDSLSNDDTRLKLTEMVMTAAKTTSLATEEAK